MRSTDTMMRSMNSIDAIVATHMARYEDATIYQLKTFDDMKISFDLKIPAGTTTSIYPKDSIGFINIKKGGIGSENIIQTIDMIRNSIYNKLRHYIPINPPNTHDQYKLRFYHTNRMINNIVKYNNQKHRISFDRLRTIMRYCCCDANILIKTLLVGKNDFTLYMYITGLTINSIPLIPETIGLQIILNKEKIEQINKYNSSNAPIKKNYVSKKEIKGNILKIFNLKPTNTNMAKI